MSASDLLKGRIALVTGASRGIGRAIALDLGVHGATVIGTATSAEGAAGIEQALAAANADGMGAMLDVTNAAACDALVSQ
ncbi:MAG: SDR family NAD(P)-dependent oxidoreductase, partial [Hyphomicrobiaceae bacterium]